jgi:murein DD-endopeptidase MepM/ murein hydrolase activator NlpD
VTNDTTIGNLALGSAAPAVPDARASDVTQQRVKEMAQQFEAMMVTQMLREMRQSMAGDDEDEKGLGKDTMIDSLDIELGGVLSRAGGFGLANALSKAMEQRAGETAPPARDALVPNGLAPLKQPLAVPVPASSDSHENSAATGDLQVPRGRVSSAYGWRSDPFNGSARFHDGIDVAQAYGQDVRAAADGRVAFAGNRGSYGTTIIVEHPGGRQTLYAHLSASDVRAGDAVGAGQVIGKSGSSGRSTGPHLHFEVLEGGHPVNPVAVVAKREDGHQTPSEGD